MEDQLTLLIVIRGILALGFVVAGIAALRIGSRLYAQGTGLKRDGTVVNAQQGKFKLQASLKTVGSVLMLTSVAWGVLAYLSLPKAKVSSDHGWAVPSTNR
jgi:hypothetical protein